MSDTPHKAASWDDLDADQAKDPLTQAFEQWRRGEIKLDELPPGRYPNGLRVYADGEWEQLIRSKPLGKREVIVLKTYFEADGAPDHYVGGYDTNCRLEVRGLIESSSGHNDHKAFRITDAGKAEWLKRSEPSNS
ncbi:hypothetical protein WN73_38460 [Bradyrhizobium sp. CCBAU 45394]|nr:hypothetical protein [Bradyrhizobium sp. CCBAU 45394]